MIADTLSFHKTNGERFKAGRTIFFGKIHRKLSGVFEQRNRHF